MSVSFPVRPTLMPWLLWSFAVLFFALQFVLRLWPGLLMPQIMQQLSLDASGFGLLAACYYYGYASMQIPVAILLDRAGVRNVIFACASLCAIASVIFVYSNEWYWAYFSRFLIGAGSAAGFLGVSRVIAGWFPASSYTRMVGLSFSAGLLGAMYGGKPLGLLLAVYPWQQVALVFALVVLATGCSIRMLFGTRAARTLERQAPQDFRMCDLRQILASPTLWLLALANLLMVGALEGFGDVWGISWLMTAYGMPKVRAAELISCIYLGMLFGGPLLAWISRWLGSLLVTALCGAGLFLVFSVLLLVSGHPAWLLASLFFITGVLSCYQVMIFALAASHVSAQCLGVTVAFLNCVNMLGGSFFHTATGFLMDAFRQGEGVGGYDAVTYGKALFLIPVCALAGALLVACAGRLQPEKRLVRAEAQPV